MLFMYAFAEGCSGCGKLKTRDLSHQTAKARNAAGATDDFDALMIAAYNIVAVHRENANIHSVTREAMRDFAGNAAFRCRNGRVLPCQQRDLQGWVLFRPLNRDDRVGVLHLSHADHNVTCR